MRLAVIQHALRATPSENVEALVAQTSCACELEADAVVIPHLEPIVDDADISRDFTERVADACIERGVVLVRFGTDAEAAPTPIEQTPLGQTAVLLGDRCLDPTVAKGLYDVRPDAVPATNPRFRQRPSSSGRSRGPSRSRGSSSSASSSVEIARTRCREPPRWAGRAWPVSAR
jgi:hypothetical protein